MPGTRVGSCVIAGIAALAAAALALPAAALAPVTTIEANQSNSFAPMTPTRPLGTVFRWQNTTAATTHTSTRTGLISWNFNLPAGQTSPTRGLDFAGAYGYYCQIHGGPGFGMHGTINVPLRAFDPIGGVNDHSGSTTTNFRITLGTRAANPGQQFEVQIRKGANGSFTLFRRTTAQRITFQAGNRGPGTYYFRSRVRKTSTTNRATGFSPRRHVVVS